MNIHDRARELVRENHGEMTMHEAYSALARRPRRRKKNYGVLHVTNTDRRAFNTVEKPQHFAWQDRADLQ